MIDDMTAPITYYLYRQYDSDGTLLYIGITKDNIKRQKEHMCSTPWAKKIARVEVEELPSQAAALAAEKAAIVSEKPIFNIVNIEIMRVISEKPEADRKRDERERMRAKGYILRQIWIMPSWWPKIKALLDRLNKGQRK